VRLQVTQHVSQVIDGKDQRKLRRAATNDASRSEAFRTLVETGLKAKVDENGKQLSTECIFYFGGP
jgi:hypothetical protein